MPGAVQHFVGDVGRQIGVPPKPRHPIVGRDQAVADLRARLMQGERAAITALHGLPGVGKTTLATALAHDDAVRRHFRGGVYWAALGPLGDVGSALGFGWRARDARANSVIRSAPLESRGMLTT